MVSLVSARAVAERVTDPELPILTLAELGILREVSEEDGKVIVSITPTYLGCPAMDTMRDDLVHALGEAGYLDVEVRTVLAPAWSSDWISERGKAKLAEAGIAPPGKAPAAAKGPVPLTLTVRDGVTCPRCGHADTTELSRFGPSACRALRRCPGCGEPFEHMKEI